MKPLDYLSLPLEVKRAIAAALETRRSEAIASRERRERGMDPIRTPVSGPQPAGDSGSLSEGGVAIIGMSGRFPGSPDLEAFWRNLAEGRDLITSAPPERWQGREIPPEAIYGGFIDGFDAFDDAFFGIAEAEAASMDPHQRLFLETSWSALEDAGYPPRRKGSPKIGLFVGMYSPDFNQLMGPGAPVRDGMRLTGRLNVMVANRVSHVLDLRGPSELVDTACSSSLVAIHRAIQAIACGDCDLAIAGGISLLLSPASTQWLGQAELLSKSGRFRPFDRRGDGLVRGEGTGAVVLKPLARAIADGDTIHAVVRSSAVNHGGRSGGALTTPNADAQADVVVSALQKGRVQPESIDYIEAHGAASDLGDFVEVGAFKRAFAQLSPNFGRESCGIGTVKANIGALDAAGGIAGVIKAVLAMRHGLWPATINYEEPRPDLGLDEGPLYIVRGAEPWVGRGAGFAPRRAAVHAFGLGGVNAHVVLEDHGSRAGEARNAEAPMGKCGGTPQLLFPFSARDTNQLRDVIVRFRDWLDTDGGSLADAAYTLRQGRAELEERVAIVAAGREELRDRLSSFLAGRACERLWAGGARAADDAPEPPPVAESLSDVASAWASGCGFPVDSALLPNRGRRIPLPTYPFLRKRFRLVGVSRGADSPFAHPLLEGFQPRAGGARFTKRLTPFDPIVADHHFRGAPLVPAAAWCEMVRGALGALHVRELRRLESLVFLRPLRVAAPGVTVTLDLQIGDGSGSFEIASEGSGQDVCACARGRISWDESGGCGGAGPDRLDFNAAAARCPKSIAREGLYAEFGRLGIGYGPSFRNLERACFNEREAIARFAMDAGSDREQASQGLRPGVLDALLQLSAVFGLEGCAVAWLPVSIEELEVSGPLPADGWVYVQRIESEGSSGVRRFHGAIADAAGRVLLKLKDLCLREAPTELPDRQSQDCAVGVNGAREVQGDDELPVGGNGSHPVQSKAPDAGRGLPGEKARDSLFPIAASYLEAVFARRLGRTGRFDWESNFERIGVDSVSVLELVRTLEETFGALAKTLLFEYNSISKLASFFIENHRATLENILGMKGRNLAADGSSLFGPPARKADAGSQQSGVSPKMGQSWEVRSPPHPASPQEIAIVGLGLRFPGARTPDELWANLAGARSSITEIPPRRWDHRRYPQAGAGEKGGARWGGFIDGVDKFDAAFFGISPREAEQMDPQERLFLEVAWETIEDAGYTRRRLSAAAWDGTSGGNVGVFVGVMYGAYQLYGSEAIDEDSPGPISPYWSVANRISYFCDFHGPSLAVDTACASSLTAIHLACESLRRNECQAALAGGVTLMVHPRQFLTLASMKMLSRDERCRAFGEGADGFVPGEGAGCVLLRPLADAIRDGDRIYGVIKGSSINAGGKTSGYTVPDPVSQGNVIAAAWRRAGVEPGTVTCIEAHGTGTTLGDPIEVRGLARAFGTSADKAGSCALGSVKSNLGHLQAAAGIASLAKVLLQLQHGQLAPTLNAEPANPLIDFQGSPFYLVKELQPWTRLGSPDSAAGAELPLRAGLSSFGVGGANAHVVVEEWMAPAKAEDGGDGEPQLIPISARTAAGLRDYAVRLNSWLGVHSEAGVSMGDLAYSWQTGREAMEHRLVILARNLAELSAKLQAFIGGRPDPDTFASGGSTPDNPVTQALGGLLHGSDLLGGLIRRKEWTQLAAIWTAGLDVDWTELHKGLARRRISIPSYPFAQKSYWVQAKDAPERAPQPLPPIRVAEPQKSELPGADAQIHGSSEIRTFLIAQIAEALRMEAGDVVTTKPFSEFGVDSLVGSRISKVLGIRLGMEVSATLLWEYPTIDALSVHLTERILRTGNPAEPVAPKDASDSWDDVLGRIGQISEADIDRSLEKLLPHDGNNGESLPDPGAQGGRPDLPDEPLGEKPWADRLKDLTPEAASDYFNRIFEAK